MSFKRVSKAILDYDFTCSGGFPPEMSHPVDFVTRWNMSYEENNALVDKQDAYYEKWLAARDKTNL